MRNLTVVAIGFLLGISSACVSNRDVNLNNSDLVVPSETLDVAQVHNQEIVAFKEEENIEIVSDDDKE